ncbi:hypothetical protein COCCU_09220 [Corynebacterium occultum]|uniref:Uncharacterized protein n=1 Tax=Corynebacterium occultum TaxID=2675219 RepID=A0A6B8WN56_9CORY|nr:hypothetical protein [Corynebacterium occultum]QGU07768.1 hypothetical protein COCCU_09220 [Corynebacterium occultum]
MSSISIREDFPVFADQIHVWALTTADFFREFGVNFPPATWGLW